MEDLRQILRSQESSESDLILNAPPPITTQDWQKSITKGKQLHDWMSEQSIERLTEKMQTSAPPRLKSGETSQSRFIRVQDLRENWWRKNPESPPAPTGIEEVTLDDYPNLEGILEDLRINPELVFNGGPHTPVIMDHLKILPRKGNVYGSSEGKFIGTLDPKDGLITVATSESPRGSLHNYFRKQGFNEAEITDRVSANMPELHHISDVMYLAWLDQCMQEQRDPKTIRMAMWYAVETAECVQVVDHILKSHGQPQVIYPGTGTYGPPTWKDRITLEPHTDEFFALLGTPNAAVNAFFLLQHKEQLGVKRVKRVHISLVSGQTVGSPDAYAGPTLTFEFEDVGDLSPKAGASAAESKKHRPGEGDDDGKSGSPKQPKHHESPKGKGKRGFLGLGKGKGSSGSPQKGKGKGKSGP